MANTGCTGFFEIVNSNIYVPFTGSSNYDMTLRTDLASQRLFIGNGSNCVAGIVLNSNYVGINMITPKYQLDVGGNMHGTSNLYLGSNTGVGNSNYPTDLSGNTGNIITSGNICAGNLGMFRNRIINGDMSINQRGFTTLTAAPGTSYFVDRFLTYNGSTVSTTLCNNQLTTNDTPYQYGHRYTYKNIPNINITSGFIENVQNIEGYNIQDFNWGQTYGSSITVSFWSRSYGISNLGVAIRNDACSYSYTTNVPVSANSVWQYNTVTIPPPPVISAGTWDKINSLNARGLILDIGSYGYSALISGGTGWYSGNFIASSITTPWINTSGNYVEFTGVQLEKGTIATPFEFRPYTTELALCQRYLTMIKPPGATNQRIGVGVGTGGSVNVLCSLPVSLRNYASLVLVFSAASNFYIYNGSSLIVCTAIVCTSNSVDCSPNLVSISASSTLSTLGNCYMLMSFNVATSYMYVSCELM